MSKDKVQELLIGAVVVVLGYALYKHFQAAPAATARPATQTPTGPAVGAFAPYSDRYGGAQPAYQPFDDKSPYTTISDPYQGTIDTGAFEGHNYLASLEGQPMSPFMVPFGPSAPPRAGATSGGYML